MQRSGSVCRRNHLRFEIQLSHSNISIAALPRDMRPLGAQTSQIHGFELGSRKNMWILTGFLPIFDKKSVSLEK